MISTIIITFNSQNQIEECFKSLEINKKIQLEILVVDNNSIDKTCQIIQKKFFHVKLIKNKANIGFAKACNQGAKIAKGKYLLFLNPDTIVKPGCIEKVVDFLEKKKDAAVVGCKMLNTDGSLQSSCGNFPSISNIILDRIPIINKIFKTVLIRQEDFYTKEQNLDWVSGAFFLVKKDVFFKLGGFNERYFMYIEEIDFCYRAKKAGYKIYYNPKAEIIHYDMGKSKERKLAKANNMRKGFSIFFKKYKSPLYFDIWQKILKIESVLKPHLRND